MMQHVMPTPLKDQGSSLLWKLHKNQVRSSRLRSLEYCYLLKYIIAYLGSVNDVATWLAQPSLHDLVQGFLYDQLYADEEHSSNNVNASYWPSFRGQVCVYHSAKVFFYAPSEISGTGGMHTEVIRSNPHWRNSYPRFDTVLIDLDPDIPGFRGMVIGRVLAFLAFTHESTRYPCALVQWFVRQDDHPSPDTGMWIVEPEIQDGQRAVGLVHLDTISCAVHLMPVYLHTELPIDFHFSYSLDAFTSFYVNKYADYHSHEYITR